MVQINELDALNDEMHSELNEVQLLNPEHQLEQVEELKEHFSKYTKLYTQHLTTCDCAALIMIGQSKCYEHE